MKTRNTNIGCAESAQCSVIFLFLVLAAFFVLAPSVSAANAVSIGFGGQWCGELCRAEFVCVNEEEICREEMIPQYVGSRIENKGPKFTLTLHLSVDYYNETTASWQHVNDVYRLARSVQEYEVVILPQYWNEIGHWPSELFHKGTGRYRARVALLDPDGDIVALKDGRLATANYEFLLNAGPTLPSLCGNGILDMGEQCDDGILNANEPDMCRLTCELPTCGDQIIDAAEQCDLGALNGQPGSTCSAMCQLTLSTCGNGVLDVGEECDQGLANAWSGTCSPLCSLTLCGDGHIQLLNGLQGMAEQCDDGNAIDNDGCTNACRLGCMETEICGNGIDDNCNGLIDEFCEDSACDGDCDDQDPLVWEFCPVPGRCGDGILDANEQCDDGCNQGILGVCEFGIDDNDGCSSACVLELCGDGIVHPFLGEQCDDGNFNNNDACVISEANNHVCKTAYCGDGFVWNSNCGPGECEQCDAGDQNGVPGSGCTVTCEYDTTNMDTFVEAVECEINTQGNWQSCFNARYADNVLGLRAKCFVPIGNNPLLSTSATLKHNDGQVNREIQLIYNADSQWLEGALTPSVEFSKSGLWNVQVTCEPIQAVVCPSRVPLLPQNWVVPFGEYFQTGAQNLVVESCCYEGIRPVVDQTVARNRFDISILLNNPGLSLGELSSKVSCAFSSGVQGCPASTVPVFGVLGSGGSAQITGPYQIADEYLCCAPELAVSMSMGCAAEYTPIVYLDNPFGGTASTQPSVDHPMVVCAAPKDATQVLECQAQAGACASTHSCIYAVSDTGIIGACDTYNNNYCCRRESS